MSLFWLRMSYIIFDPLACFINGRIWDGINGEFILCVIFSLISFKYTFIAFMVP